jgi:6-phosphofructokinase 1
MFVNFTAKQIMPKQIKKIGVLTSKDPPRNAAIRAAVRTCAYHHIECRTFYRGYQGMIEGKISKKMGVANNIVNKKVVQS